MFSQRCDRIGEDKGRAPYLLVGEKAALIAKVVEPAWNVAE